MSQNAWVKLSLLSHGISPTPEFVDWFGSTSGFVRRRNFYNSPNWTTDSVAPLPQEILLRGDERVIVAVNDYGGSPWQLTWTAEDGPTIRGADGVSYPVDLVPDLTAIEADAEVARLCNLYGGSALAFFTPRACYFFADGTQCRFCSLDGTARENDSFAGRVTPAEMRKAVGAVVAADDSALNQVMIVGGNERNLDRGFQHQIDLVWAATEALTDAGLVDKVSVHLIAMPPQDLSIIDRLRDVPNMHAGFNLEVWDPDRFTTIAPGKHQDYTQAKILTALGRLRDAIGPYRAHSILISGLEAPAATLDGAGTLAADGISPIVNTYHSDRHSSLGLTIRPTYRHLAEVAAGVQELHDRFPIQPYWKGCGRNAIDYEAAHGMFRGAPAALN